jgi:hypothetical protein
LGLQEQLSRAVGNVNEDYIVSTAAGAATERSNLKRDFPSVLNVKTVSRPHQSTSTAHDVIELLNISIGSQLHESEPNRKIYDDPSSTQIQGESLSTVDVNAASQATAGGQQAKKMKEQEVVSPIERGVELLFQPKKGLAEILAARRRARVETELLSSKVDNAASLKVVSSDETPALGEETPALGDETPALDDENEVGLALGSIEENGIQFTVD